MKRLVAFYFVLTLSCAAGAGPKEAKSLRGLRRFDVLIEHLDADAESIGLNADTLKVDVELRLRTAGIKTVSDPEAPYVYVYITVLRIEALRGAAYSVAVRVQSNVKIIQTGKMTNATIWESGKIGTGSSVLLRDAVRKTIGGLVDQLTHDILSVR